ncbi:hypothetical protein WIS52_20125 [Pseudonocardia nematodicida]|uniref:Uncharacterized protein n=1 Tax=Pseudonocardia nematodicida TaxID=1206997 RepID=A0ABV1KEA2_9PSEU
MTPVEFEAKLTEPLTLVTYRESDISSFLTRSHDGNELAVAVLHMVAI